MTEPEPNDPTKIALRLDPLIQRMSGTTLQGGIDFDVPYISQITPELWQGGCAGGLILPTHINYLVSLYPWERYTLTHKLRGEMYIRMYDDPGQALDQIDDIARQVGKWRNKGTVLVHCQAGLNRSSLVVVRSLMMKDGLTAEEAIALIRSKRSPACLANKAFETWLKQPHLRRSYT